MKLSMRDMVGAVLSSTFLLAVAGLYNWSACTVRRCSDDDGMGIVQAIPTVPELGFYLLPYWLAVFPLGWWLSRRWGEWLGFGAAVMLCALLAAAVLHRPFVHGTLDDTLLVIVPACGLPWSAALLFHRGAWRWLARRDQP